jgi:sugar O-acyltransferase (sialic acid O-acetyltransferase NeuD family)
MSKDVIIIGYSGHSYEIIETFLINKINVKGYCEPKEKTNNPFSIKYLGDERKKDSKIFIENNSFFIAIGDNKKRSSISEYILKNKGILINAIHSSSSISSGSIMGKGNFIGRNSCINYESKLGDNIIINTASIIEHETIIESSVHIGPGAVICGGVKIKKESFIGANTVIKENLTIGQNVIIGAGSVVIRNVPDDSILYGNPAKIKNVTK